MGKGDSKEKKSLFLAKISLYLSTNALLERLANFYVTRSQKKTNSENTDQKTLFRKPLLFRCSTLTFPLFIKTSFFSHSWKGVSEDEDADFNYLEQEIHTNSSTKSYTVEHLQPYTVYSFQVAAVNHVGRSRPSKNSYPSITLRESKLYHTRLLGASFGTSKNNQGKKFSSVLGGLFVLFLLG